MSRALLRSAVIAAILGPTSHYLLWIRLNVDKHSHQLLLFANVVVLFGPLTLTCLGFSLSRAVSLSLTVEFCYAASLLGSIALYRAYLHPLCDYRGPFWARISVFWKIKHFKQSDYRAYRVIDRLHRDFGDVVRVGPRQLSFNDAQAYQIIYGANSECHRLESLEQIRKNLQSLSNVNEHRARRRVWDHGLSSKACQSYMPRVNDITTQFCRSLSKFNGSPVVINDWCHYYTFDIMGDIGFGRTYGQIESGQVHPAVLKVHNFLKAGVIAIQILWAVNFLRLIPGLDDPMRDLKEWAEQLLRERARLKPSEKDDCGQKDLMSYVEESQRVVDHDWPISSEEMVEDAVTLQIAGSDTSYSAIANLCHYLANYPGLQEKIRQETRQTFLDDTSHSMPSWSKLGSPQLCPYLDATVKEVLRCHAPVPQGTLRETPDHAINIAGHIVPPNTIVSCPIWTLQHNERCFLQPDDFVPERWLDSAHPCSRAHLTLDKRGFVPFSIGPMNCAGKYFAYLEIKVFVAKVLRQFDVSYPFVGSESGDATENQQRARDMALANGLRDYLTQVVGYPIQAMTTGFERSSMLLPHFTHSDMQYLKGGTLYATKRGNLPL